MIKFIKVLLLIAILLVVTGWGACALYFGDSHTATVQTVLAGMFVLSGMMALIALAVPRLRSRVLKIHGVLFVCILVWWLNIAPSNDRQWQADVGKLAYATFDGDLVTVHDVRNFDYKSEFDYSPAYYTKTYDLNKLQGVDLFAIYWMGPAIAHTIISFDFGEGNHLAVSIEARKEKNEGYSTIKGFFRQYELIYIVADERDVIRLRTNYRKDPPEQVYLYSLRGTRENAKSFFLEYIRQINMLHDNPAFYNTLIDNCTTTIWMNAHVNPGRPPLSWKILASGYLPAYLYESGLIDHRLPFTELQKRAYINDRAHQADQAPDFSQRIRIM
jgi:Domain of unknown function (DUF4105)